MEGTFIGQNFLNVQNLTGSKGVVTSPGFPRWYPHNLTQTINITSPKDTKLILKFEVSMKNYLHSVDYSRLIPQVQIRPLQVHQCSNGFVFFLQSLSIEQSFNAGKKCSYDQLILSEPFKQDVVLCGQINSSHSEAEESSMVTKRNLSV